MLRTPFPKLYRRLQEIKGDGVDVGARLLRDRVTHT